MNALSLEARLLMHQGAAEQAAQLLSRPWPTPPEKSMQAEYLATWAVALACTGNRERALDEASNAASLSRGIEAAVLVEAARALVCDDSNSTAQAAELFAVAEKASNYDGLIFASRLSPRLARDLSAEPSQRRVLTMIIHDIGDYALAERMAIPVPTPAAAENLTRRERQVYDLLALGLTNKEIASRLFISESTAKVHSMHIREKLGLRSKTEIALHAIQSSQAARMSTSDDHRS
jgi:DNA-binding NarL/FixJ family response regulator